VHTGDVSSRRAVLDDSEAEVSVDDVGSTLRPCDARSTDRSAAEIDVDFDKYVGAGFGPVLPLMDVNCRKSVRVDSRNELRPVGNGSSKTRWPVIT